MIRTSLPEKYYDYDGLRIRYMDIGSGPTIVFHNGLGGKIEDNHICFPLLTDRFRIIAMDCPGTGYSDKPDRKYDIDYLLDFSMDFVKRLGIERYYLVGGSQGGMHVLLNCLRAPEQVAAACVYSASGVWKRNPLFTFFFNHMPPGFVRHLLRFTSKYWYSPGWSGAEEANKAAIEYIDHAEMPGFGKHVLGCLASQFARDYMSMYANVTTPVRILWGEKDTGMPSSMGDKLHAVLKNSDFIRVPGAGHNLSTEMPEYFAEKISEHLLKYPI